MHNSLKDMETDLNAHNQEEPRTNSFKLYTVLLKTKSSAWRILFTTDSCGHTVIYEVQYTHAYVCVQSQCSYREMGDEKQADLVAR